MVIGSTLASQLDFTCEHDISYFLKCFSEDETVSAKDVCVNYDASYREICGYAEVPEPSHPGELKVERCQTFLRIIFFKTGKDIQIFVQLLKAKNIIFVNKIILCHCFFECSLFLYCCKFKDSGE
jgi:hypothetical protein